MEGELGRVGDYDLVIDQAQRLGEELGEDLGKRFYLKATGQAGTDIDKHIEQWLAENPCAPRTSMERRSAIKTLAQWRGGLDVEKIDRDMARAYVEEVISPGRAAATINKQLGILATYWHWLMHQGQIPEVPVHWSKFRRKAPREGYDLQERPFTSEEMVMLFSRPMRLELRDAAMLSALLGARLEEIASLRVKHVNLAGMTIHLPGTKTASAERTIPIHSGLKPILARRLKGKSDRMAWLFSELLERKSGDAKGRSTVLSKAFTRHRQAVGVDARAEGKRRALTNFHSFRRWFITEAERAGGVPWIVESIVGHKRLGMAFGRYSGGPGVQVQMRDVMDKVTLPVEITDGLRGGL